MINVEEKLKVFISSKTGDDPASIKYNLARKAIKELLESTGLFKTYVFEDSGATSASAFRNYTTALEGCDVCIFLIDNADGVPEGVAVEIETATKYNIPSLYYFCDEREKEKTAVQKSLLHADAPKSKPIHSFEEFIQNGSNDLINDILNTYRNYSKGRITFSDREKNINEQASIDTEMENDFSSSEKNNQSILNKSQFKNAMCREYFSTLLFNTGEKGKDQEKNLDYYSSKLLPVLFENKNMEEFNLTLYLNELSKEIPSNYFDVIELRWQSNLSYFTGKLENSITQLKEVYNKAQEVNLAEWFIQDVLIDLRNRIHIFYGISNEIVIDNYGQKELSKRSEILYYPIIDRKENNLLQWIEKDRQKNELKSYTSKTFLGDMSMYSDYIADIFFQAMAAGSLTHLTRIYDMIQKLSYELCVFTDDWSWLMVTLKNTIISLDYKKVHLLVEHFESLLTQMNDQDAKSVYDYSNNVILSHQRFTANLIAISEIGYYLNNKDFESIWDQLQKKVMNWSSNADSIVKLEKPIFQTLEKIHERISDDYIVEFSINILSSNKKRYFDSTFKLLAKTVNFDSISDKNFDTLVETLIEIISEEKSIPQRENLKKLCSIIGNENKVKILELEGTLKLKWTDYYTSEYLPETRNDYENKEQLLQKQIEIIRQRNQEQGGEGIISMYVRSPFKITQAFIYKSDDVVQKDVIDQLFKVTCDTIMNNKQVVDDKIDAFILLLFLCRYDRKITERNKEVIELVISNKNVIEAQETMISFIDKSLLSLASSLLRSCFGEDTWLDILSDLSNISEEGSQVIACKLIKEFLGRDYYPEVSKDIQGLIFQYSLQWSNSPSTDVRWHTTHILIQLLNVPLLVEVISTRLIRIMEKDNAFVKSQLIHRVEEIGRFDKAAQEYIKTKAERDSNYVIREIAASKFH